ncbi:MAG: WG repeat-containing protein [Acidaminococcaceae bacterium]
MLRSLRFFAMVIGLIFAIQISCVAAPSDDGHLFPVKRGNLAGFIDIKGDVIIPLQFAEVGEFSEGLAAAQDVESGKWGYIDRIGTFIISPQFRTAGFFSEGLAGVRIEDSDGWFINHSGELVIQGYDGGSVQNGLVPVRKQGKTIFTDKSGKEIFAVPGEAWPVNGGLIAFMKNGRMGFVDNQGIVVIKPLYHCDVNWRDQQFEEKITPVSKLMTNGKPKFGFIDIGGKTVVDFQYDWAEQFFDGLAMVSKVGKYGYVNTAGELSIPLQFDGADHFSEGFAAVEVNGRWGFIDTKGKIVIEPKYLPRCWGSPMVFCEGLAAVRTETGTGFINKNGEIVVPAVYSSVGDFADGLATVGSLGHPGYVNSYGKVVWSPNISGKND